MRLKFLLPFFLLPFFWTVSLRGGDLATKDDLAKQEKQIQAFGERIEQISKDLQEKQANLSEEILSSKDKIEGINGDTAKSDYQLNQQKERLDLLEKNLLLREKEKSEKFTLINENLTNLEKSLLELNNKIEKVSTEQGKFSLSSKEEKEYLEKKINVLLEEVTAENDNLRKRLAKLEKTVYLVGVYYTVKEGETLAQIAKNYKTSLEEIIKANKIEDPSLLSIGQRLFIPQK